MKTCACVILTLVIATPAFAERGNLEGAGGFDVSGFDSERGYRSAAT